jgi:hypothetical protein
MSKANTGGPAFPHIDSGCGRFEEGMTLRQYAAIKLKVPDSGIDWLDDMIEEANRLDREMLTSSSQNSTL